MPKWSQPYLGKDTVCTCGSHLPRRTVAVGLSLLYVVHDVNTFAPQKIVVSTNSRLATITHLEILFIIFLINYIHRT